MSLLSGQMVCMCECVNEWANAVEPHVTRNGNQVDGFCQPKTQSRSIHYKHKVIRQNSFRYDSWWRTLWRTPNQKPLDLVAFRHGRYNRHRIHSILSFVSSGTGLDPEDAFHFFDFISIFFNNIGVAHHKNIVKVSHCWSIQSPLSDNSRWHRVDYQFLIDRNYMLKHKLPLRTRRFLSIINQTKRVLFRHENYKT